MISVNLCEFDQKVTEITRFMSLIGMMILQDVGDIDLFFGKEAIVLVNWTFVKLDNRNYVFVIELDVLGQITVV